jgi:hypothetical protein
MVPKCIFCGRLVLEIAGDGYVSTVCFGRARDASILQFQEEIAEGNIYGHCHACCLAASPWFEKWLAVTEAFLSEQGFYQVIFGDPDVFSAPNDNSLSLHFHELRTVISLVEGGVGGADQDSGRLNCQHDKVYWDISGYFDQVRLAVAVPGPGEHVRLRDIAAALEISDVYDDLILDEGIFKGTEQTPTSFQRDRVLFGQLFYPILLPGDLAIRAYHHLRVGGARLRQEIVESGFNADD